MYQVVAYHQELDGEHSKVTRREELEWTKRDMAYAATELAEAIAIETANEIPESFYFLTGNTHQVMVSNGRSTRFEVEEVKKLAKSND